MEEIPTEPTVENQESQDENLFIHIDLLQTVTELTNNDELLNTLKEYVTSKSEDTGSVETAETDLPDSDSPVLKSITRLGSVQSQLETLSDLHAGIEVNTFTKMMISDVSDALEELEDKKHSGQRVQRLLDRLEGTHSVDKVLNPLADDSAELLNVGEKLNIFLEDYEEASRSLAGFNVLSYTKKSGDRLKLMSPALGALQTFKNNIDSLLSVCQDQDDLSSLLASVRENTEEMVVNVPQSENSKELQGTLEQFTQRYYGMRNGTPKKQYFSEFKETQN